MLNAVTTTPSPDQGNQSSGSVRVSAAEVRPDNGRAGTSGQAPPAVAAVPPVPPVPPPHQWTIPSSRAAFEDPLLWCLAALASLLGRPISTTALSAGLPLENGRFAPELAVRAMERAEMRSRLIRRPTVREINPITLPCILLLKNGGACLLLRFLPDKRARISTPEDGGEREVTLAELQDLYAGYAFFAQPGARYDNRTEDVQLVDVRRWFWGTIFKFVPIYRHVILASLVINMFAIASPLFTMNVYDRVVPNNAMETLWVLAFGVTLVFLFDFILRMLRSYFVDVAGKNADVIIASHLLQHVTGMRLDNRPESSGTLANNLREFESLREFFSSSTLLAVVDLPFVVIFIYIIFLIGGQLAIIPCVVVPVVLIIGYLLQFPLKYAVQKTYRESAQKHALLVEVINGLETIKFTGAEGQIQRQWEKLVGLTAESTNQAKFISSFSNSFTGAASQLSTVAIVVYGVYLISDGTLTTGSLVACSILIGRVMAPLGAVTAMLTRFQQSRVALKGLDILMKAPLERGVDKTFIHRPHLSADVELRNVTFCYPHSRTKALDGVSVRITAGEKVGIIGRIGSGKSTIGRLVVGLYEPAEGAVLVGRTDIRQLDPADLRSKVGYVAQDNFLFYGSLRDNIVFGAPQVDDTAVLRACHIAGVTDFLRSMPQGFDLPVGERGTALSGGQRQSIAVARSLLLDPPILILDEPTSSMDNSSEMTFKTRLGEVLASKTLILITHRASMLTLVDRLVILDAGKVVADGPRADVLEALRKGQVRMAP